MGKKILTTLAVLGGLALPFLLFYPGPEAEWAQEEPTLMAALDEDDAKETPKATSSPERSLKTALSHLDRGETQKAVQIMESLRSAESRQPEFPIQVRAHLAEAYLVLGDTLNAESFSAQAVKVGQKNSLAWGVRGRVLLHLHRMNESLEAYQKATELNVKNFIARGNLAYVWLLRQDFSRARYLLEESVGIAETNAMIPPTYVFHNLGVAYQKEGEFAKARDAYRRAAEGGLSASESLLARVEVCLQDRETCVELVEEFTPPAKPPLVTKPR